MVLYSDYPLEHLSPSLALQPLFLWTTEGLSVLSDVSQCQCLEEDTLTSDLFNVQFVSAAFV